MALEIRLKRGTVPGNHLERLGGGQGIQKSRRLIQSLAPADLHQPRRHLPSACQRVVKRKIIGIRGEYEGGLNDEDKQRQKSSDA
ncbi:MAG: hypothetical protein HC875_39285 [Anaerolineales bacterium]|nr:hypothetical protein [Anaerolineales bacterium]